MQLLKPRYLVVVASSCQMYSGTGRIIMDWIEYAGKYFDFTLLMDDQNSHNQEIAKAFCQAAGIEFLTSAPEQLPGCIDSGNERLAYMQQYYDVVEMFSWASGAVNVQTISYCDRAGKPVIGFSPFSQPIDTIPDHENHYNTEPYFRFALNRANAVFLLSNEETKLEAFDECADRQKLHLIYGGVNPSKHIWNGDKRNRNEILCAMDFREKRKRFDLVLEAFEIALIKRPDLRLLLVGKGSDQMHIPDEVTSNKVLRYGYVSDEKLTELYRKSTLLISLADYEAFCLPIAEALATGCPVLINDTDLMGELFRELPGVHLVKNKKTDDVARKILDIVSIEADSNYISKAALTKFGYDTVYSKKLQTVKRLISDKKTDNPKFRVLHFTPKYYSKDSVIGGGEKYVNYMVKALALAHGNQFQSDILAVSDEYNVHEYSRYAKLITVNLSKDSKSLRILKYVIDSYDIIVVHQCLTNEALYIAANARIMDKIVLGIDHGGGECEYIRRKKEISDSYDGFIAQSEFAKIAFMDLGKEVYVIKGMYDNLFYRTQRRSYASSCDIVAIGRVLPHKGFETIIKAMPCDASLTIVGQPYHTMYYEYLVKLAFEMGKKVTFVHDADDFQLRDIICGASVMVHASTHKDIYDQTYPKPELLGLAPLEALGCGIPVLVSTAGALTELVDCEGCDSFKDVRELSDKLEQHRNNQLTHAQRQSISHDAADKYGLINYARKFQQMIECLSKNTIRGQK